MSGLRRACGPLAAGLALALAACGGPKPRVLHIYNWSDYIDPIILKDFTHQTGIKVVYDTFDSNEVLETKVLTGGTGYDLVVPSNNNLPRYIAAHAIQPLHAAKLPNAKNLDPAIMTRLAPFDPGAKYAVPYMWGTIGIGYNVDAVAKRLPGVKIDSWSVVLEPQNLAKLKDCGVYFLDASEDMFATEMNYLGLDPNSRNLADYQKAEQKLEALRPYVRKFHSSEYINALASGDICIAIGYSGDVIQARNRAAQAGGKTHIAYVIPQEGAQVWFDVFAMPVDAPDPEAGYSFLNYMLRPEVIARASNHTGYANANAAARNLIDPTVRDDPNIYPGAAAWRRLFVTTTKDQTLLRQVNRLWTHVLTGR